MTAETAPGQAWGAPGDLAEPGPARSLPDRMARYGIWLAVITHILLHDRRFQATVITGVIGTYALASVIKNNQAQPVRRAVAWYNVRGEVHDIKVLHSARGALKPGNARSGDGPGRLSRGVETAMLKLLYKPVAIVAGIVGSVLSGLDQPLVPLARRRTGV